MVGDSGPLLRARTDTALAVERAAQAQQLADLRAGASKLQEALDSAKTVIGRQAVQLEAMRIQRDRARQLLGQALAVQQRRCGPLVMVGGGYGIRGADAGGFVGYGCRL